MNFPNPFKLEKLAIHVHRREPAGDETQVPPAFRWVLEKTLYAMFNPSSYSMSYGNKYRAAADTSGKKPEQEVAERGNDQLNLEFVFDGTGVAALGFETLLSVGSKSVTEQVYEISSLGFDLEPESHTTRFLILEWGDSLFFQCRLSNMEVSYTLFDSAGRPLRAKVNATFVQSKPPWETERENESHSADISRYRMVKMEDTFLQMTKDVYGSYDYCAAAARANDLDQFRRVKPGTTLIFPPLNELKT